MSSDGVSGPQSGAQGVPSPDPAPEQRERLQRAAAANEPRTEAERRWRARTLKSAAVESSDRECVIIFAEDVRLTVVLEHIAAGRIVIVVPEPPELS